MTMNVKDLIETERDTLAALADTIVPPDEWAGGWRGGFARLLDEHGDDFLSFALPIIAQAVEQVNAAAQERHGARFGELDDEVREALFADLVSDETPPDFSPTTKSVDGSRPLRSLISLVFQGFYAGTREPAGWGMVGYSAVPEGVTPLDTYPPVGKDNEEIEDHYDVIIVGSGAGGGVVAAELSEAGKHVLLIERAAPYRDSELRGNHIQGKRAALYDVTASPHAGNPRIVEGHDGISRVVDGNEGAGTYGLVAMALGGGTRVWQGMSWRFWPQDFAMATTYGAPPESTLVDWPISYEDLAPFYDRAEWELGVSGDADSAMALPTPRLRPYPMPPLPDDPTRVALSAAADRLSWKTSPIPFAINSVPREGRPACVRCSQCVGHACPVNAKNGTHNTFIPRALATGNCDLLMSTQVVEIVHDGNGVASGVRVMVNTESHPSERIIRCDRVVVSAGAVETLRLLLASGLGNSWVGRNHHSHGAAAAIALDLDIKTNVGPGHSVATVDHVHSDPAAWGGGVLFDMPPAFPLDKAEFGRFLSGAEFGRAHKQWMRDTPPFAGTLSMVQEIPHEYSRITIDPAYRDRFGVPAARLQGRAHPASLAAAEYMADAGERWLREAGASGVFRMAEANVPQGSEHSAGTARMGHDPSLAATDPQGLLYGTKNVYVADASLHPTNGGFNPALTVMANAMRVASLMK